VELKKKQILGLTHGKIEVQKGGRGNSPNWGIHYGVVERGFQHEERVETIS